MVSEVIGCVVQSIVEQCDRCKLVFVRDVGVAKQGSVHIGEQLRWQIEVFLQ